MNKLFFELVRVAIGNGDGLSHIPTVEEWKKLYAMAKKQSLVGVCFAGVQKLHSNQSPLTSNISEVIYLQWMCMAANLQQQSEKHQDLIGKVSVTLELNGIDAIFMKGLVCASRYPDPMLRQCGDIDFVVHKEDYTRTLDALDKVADVDRSLVHEHHGMAHMDGVQLEPHFKIHNYQNPWNDRMMRRLQKEVIDAPASYVAIVRKNIRKFPMEFEGMFLVSHMVNHVYEEGLGLRQVMDFAMWLNYIDDNDNSSVNTNCTNQANKSSGFDMELYHAYLDKMHMRRAARIFTLICEKYLGVEQGIFGYGYTNKEMAFADKLMADIMAVGNFAKEVNLEAGWNAYMWTTKRAMTLGYLCLSEAYWWPVSKLYRYINKSIINK